MGFGEFDFFDERVDFIAALDAVTAGVAGARSGSGVAGLEEILGR